MGGARREGVAQEGGCLCSARQADLRYIGRDALGGLLGLVGERGGRVEGTRVLDLRRHDERTLYGSIPGGALPPDLPQQLAHVHALLRSMR